MRTSHIISIGLLLITAGSDFVWAQAGKDYKMAGDHVKY
jgi:hypothetical protein